MNTIIQTFRKRSMARMAFLSSSISEICNSWEHCDDASSYSLMKPYRFRRVLNSENPTISDCELVSIMLGVELGSLMFSGGTEDLESTQPPRHLVEWRDRETESPKELGAAKGE